jgi:hypothetical protein
MTLSSPKIEFGLHSLTLYNPSTFLPYGTIRVANSATVESTAELIEQFGGSSSYAWAAEEGTTDSTVSIEIGEHAAMMYEPFQGATATDNAAEASGSVDTLANVYGTSVVDASTGIATIGVKSGEEANVKFCCYVVKAASATTVDVYALTNLDFKRGEDLTFTDDTLLIASGLTITTSTAVEIVDDSGNSTGLELTGGSGTISMTTGDTAKAWSRPINTDSYDVTVGASGQVIPEIGVILTGQTRGTNEMVSVDLFKVKMSGLPESFETKAFTNRSLTGKVLYDTSRNGVYLKKYVLPTNAA